VKAGGDDNHEPLQQISWQVHVYGEPAEGLAAWCNARSLPLHVFGWTQGHAAAGLLRSASYLIRPDTYVALAESSGGPGTLERYFAQQQIKVG
jgi:hypothetical protein